MITLKTFFIEYQKFQKKHRLNPKKFFALPLLLEVVSKKISPDEKELIKIESSGFSMTVLI